MRANKPHLRYSWKLRMWFWVEIDNVRFDGVITAMTVMGHHARVK